MKDSATMKTLARYDRKNYNPSWRRFVRRSAKAIIFFEDFEEWEVQK